MFGHGGSVVRAYARPAEAADGNLAAVGAALLACFCPVVRNDHRSSVRVAGTMTPDVKSCHWLSAATTSQASLPGVKRSRSDLLSTYGLTIGVTPSLPKNADGIDFLCNLPFNTKGATLASAFKLNLAGVPAGGVP